MDARQAASKMKEKGFNLVRVHPNTYTIDEWPDTKLAKLHEWQADTVHGFLVPTDGDAYTAIYGTLHCFKEPQSGWVKPYEEIG